MKHRKNMCNHRLLSVLLVILSVLSVRAQDLVVYHVVGNVESQKDGKNVPLSVKDILHVNSVVNVPFEGNVELLDEKNSKRYSIHSAGKGTILQLCQSEGNHVQDILKSYVNYVKRQLLNSEKVVEAQKYTDFAVVTREVKEYKKEEEKKNNPRSLFDDFAKKARDEFDDFRSKANSQYTEFVRQAWEEFTSFSGIPQPKEIRVEPVVFSEEQATDKIHLAKWLKKVFKSSKDSSIVRPLTKEEFSSKPQPIGKVKPVPVPAQEEQFSEMPFTFFGNEWTIHLDETKRFNLGGVSRGQVADALTLLSKKSYDNALLDCLKIREKYDICDWGYLMMLMAIGDQFCGPGTNESTLLAGYLYSQSGYRMRYATDGTKLYLLVACKQRMYGKNYFVIDDVDYFPICEGQIPDRISICSAAFDNEQSMSLAIAPQQDFALLETEKRTIRDRFNNSSLDVSVNKNMIDFYGKYPSFTNKEDLYSRWIFYANTPLDKRVAEQIYPQILDRIKGLSVPKAVECILQWIQYGIPYAFDDQVWGGDRVFFAEETLYYPAADCEDRAILFTRIVRDLLHLPCVLVYYPGHLAAAVHFSEEVRGDRFQLGDADYIVCDPTYIGGPMGMSMPGMKIEEAKLILLE